MKSCTPVGQKLLIPSPCHNKGAKTGLSSRFYLNCSHMPMLLNSLRHVYGTLEGNTWTI